MIKIIGIALICALVSFLLSELGFRGKKLISVIVCLLLFSFMGQGLSNMIGKFIPYSEAAGLSEAAVCAAKVIGVGYIFGITSDILTELGEPMPSKALTAVGRVEIILIVLPYISDIIDLGLKLIG